MLQNKLFGIYKNNFKRTLETQTTQYKLNVIKHILNIEK